MKIEIILPQMGESVSEGTILKWFKKPGDNVEKDEILFEISTDKVDTEIPSPTSGIVTEITVHEGETIAIGTVLGSIETEVEKAGAKPLAAKPVEAESEPAQQYENSAYQPEAPKWGQAQPSSAPKEPEPMIDSSPPVPVAAKPEIPQEPFVSTPVQFASSGDGTKRFYSPLVLRIAQEEGIPLAALEELKGTGIGGRITKKDILSSLETLKKAPEAPPAQAPVTITPAVPVESTVPAAIVRARPDIKYSDDGTSVVPMDNMRVRIAEHMVYSVQTSPHVTSVSEADVTEMVKYRQRENPGFTSREGFSLNYTAIITRALTLAVRDFPELNASVEGKNVIYKKHVNIGVAVALENGLIVPVVKNTEEKNIVGLAREIHDLSSRARTKKLLPDEVLDSTISITNFGSFGNLFGTPIINQPNVAIIGIGAIKKRPMVVGDGIAIRDMMYLSLTFDHRLIDGATGGMFLQKMVEYLENVESLLKI